MDPRLHEVDVPLGAGAIQRVRYFSDSAIQTAVDSALERIDSSKSGVILRGRVDSEGAAAVLAARVNNFWSVGLIADYRRVTGELGVGFETVFEW
jgi:hypothetical protein